MVFINRAAAGQNLLLQAKKVACQLILDIVWPLMTHSYRTEPTPVDDWNVLEIHDVFKNEPARASQMMSKFEPQLHGAILAVGSAAHMTEYPLLQPCTRSAGKAWAPAASRGYRCSVCSSSLRGKISALTGGPHEPHCGRYHFVCLDSLCPKCRHRTAAPL